MPIEKAAERGAPKTDNTKEAKRARLAALEKEDAASAKGASYAKEFAVVVIGGKTRIIRCAAPWEPPMTATDFVLAMRDEGKAADKWLVTSPRNETFARMRFDPSTLEQRLPDNSFNTWRGFALEPSPKGSWALLQEHLMTLCSGREQLFDYVLDWCAHLIQFPHIKAGVALLLYGPQGTGKDTLGDALAMLMRPANYRRLQSGQQLTDTYNGAALLHTLLMHCEELWVKRQTPSVGILKGLITSPTITVRFMRTDPFNAENSMRLLLTSNEREPVHVEPGDRRFQAIEVPEHAHTRDNEHFGRLRAQLFAGGAARFMHDLLARKINDDCVRRLVSTREHAELKASAMPPVAQFVASVAARQPKTRANVAPAALHLDYVKTFPKDTLSLIQFGRELSQLGVAKGRESTGKRRPVYLLADPYPVRARLQQLYPSIEEHYDFGPSGPAAASDPSQIEDASVTPSVPKQAAE